MKPAKFDMPKADRNLCTAGALSYITVTSKIEFMLLSFSVLFFQASFSFVNHVDSILKFAVSEFFCSSRMIGGCHSNNWL